MKLKLPQKWKTTLGITDTIMKTTLFLDLKHQTNIRFALKKTRSRIRQTLTKVESNFSEQERN